MLSEFEMETQPFEMDLSALFQDMDIGKTELIRMITSPDIRDAKLTIVDVKKKYNLETLKRNQNTTSTWGYVTSSFTVISLMIGVLAITWQIIKRKKTKKAYQESFGGTTNTYISMNSIRDPPLNELQQEATEVLGEPKGEKPKKKGR